MSTPERKHCEQTELVSAFAIRALAANEAAAMEAHLASCERCREELAALRPIVEGFTAWPTDLLRAPASVQERLADRIAGETGSGRVVPPSREWREPEWKQVAPGIECKLLAQDEKRERISMAVRLAPGAEYPPHEHAGVEELHLLDGELWIDERKLYPGDYNRAEPGTADQRVWSETGCTCVLITSTRDMLR
jgi:anti-sigma factor ChrR (cupin superfamily)